MKKYLLLLLSCGFIINVLAQNNCNAKHQLFQLSKDLPINTVTVLGLGKEFIPLHCVNSTQELLNNIQNKTLWKKYPEERKELDSLLKEIKFTGGINDLKINDILPKTIPYGTIGNLGGTKRYPNGKRKIEYHFSKLNIYGRKKTGISSWKITSPQSGCYFYILKECGNAFYSKDTACCCTAIIKLSTDTLRVIKPKLVSKKAHITVLVYNRVSYYSPADYLTIILKGKKRSTCKPDTTKVSRKDTVITIEQPESTTYTVFIDTTGQRIRICTEAVDIKGKIKYTALIPPEVYPTPVKGDTIKYYYHTYEPINNCGNCKVKFELGVNGGIAFNTVPSIDNESIHTRATGSHFTGDIYLGYLFSTKLQAGIDIGYFTLAYLDDANYSKPNSGNYHIYNDVYLAKPIIPIQVYGKVSFGISNLTSNILLSAGYATVSNSQIQNNGTLLTNVPSVKGGFTASIGFGADYFFNCHFGIGTTIKASYFSLKGDNQNYNLFAYPITAGLRYRF